MKPTSETVTETSRRLDFFLKMIENGTVSRVAVISYPFKDSADIVFGFDTDDGTGSSDVKVECTLSEAVKFIVPAMNGHRGYKESSWSEENEEDVVFQ